MHDSNSVRRQPASPHPHQQADYYNLAWFRDNGYAVETSPSLGSRGFVQVAPGKLKKVYSAPPPKNIFYRVSRFRLFDWDMPGELLRSPEEIANDIDRRSFEELLPQATGALGQLLIRAGAGDETALLFFAHRAYDLAVQLQTLQTLQPAKLQALAETFDRWPVLLSHNQQDIDSARKCISSLHVGEKAFPPTGKGQKFGRASFWTRLAAGAVDECQMTGLLVRIFNETQVKNVHTTRRVTNKLWGASVTGTYYYVPEELLITDWERDSAKLSLPITKDNFKAWWAVIREYVREYWRCSDAAYASALKIIGQRETREAIRRNMAFDRVEQALRSLTGVQ